MKHTAKHLLAAFAAATLLSACEKVSPIGVLVSGTGVEDRVKMSASYFHEHKNDFNFDFVEGDYTFLVGGDSHLTTDGGRLGEMFQSALDNNDLFVAHLGDIADTKAEYYINLDNIMDTYKDKYIAKYYDSVFVDSLFTTLYYRKDSEKRIYETSDEIKLPFYPVVGNHDITHNGWALWSNMFHSSFYQYDVMVSQSDGKYAIDHYIFLDSANGTLGEEQVKLIEDGIVSGDFDDSGLSSNKKYSDYRYIFVFTHTNIFRPSSLQFASTFAREEAYYLINRFTDWEVSAVFMGHVHKWDERQLGDTRYVTLESMSERNSPDPGEYLVRVHVSADTFNIERVMMNYTAK